MTLNTKRRFGYVTKIFSNEFMRGTHLFCKEIFNELLITGFAEAFYLVKFSFVKVFKKIKSLDIRLNSD